MKIAITGAKGRLGRDLRRHFEGLRCEVMGFSRNADAAHASLGSLSQELHRDNFDALVHLAWSTVPSTAETDPGVEWREHLPLLSAMLRDLDMRRVAGKRSLLSGKKPQSERADRLLPRPEADGESAASTVLFVVGMGNRN